MRKKPIFVAIPFCIACAVTVFSCERAMPDRESLKVEIIEVESMFCEYVRQNGIAAGFEFFADDSATLLRERDSLIKGKSSIFLYYSNPKFHGAKVDWKPDFVEVSKSGDLAYTYGHYTWKIPKTNADTLVAQGVFHTICKHLTDGTWKYVWD